ncbi:hypothetical protein [uncultured Bdellovibrio sp.]|nr:hypothetical protein [uncultured Bdellovibrio sp.]
MLMYLSPSNWFLIFLAFLLTGYLKIASAKPTKPVFFASSSFAQILR